MVRLIFLRFFRSLRVSLGSPDFFQIFPEFSLFLPLGKRGGGGGKSTNPVIGKCPKDKPRRVKMFITTSGDKYISKENINLLKDLLASVVTLFFSGLYLDFWCGGGATISICHGAVSICCCAEQIMKKWRYIVAGGHRTKVKDRARKFYFIFTWSHFKGVCFAKFEHKLGSWNRNLNYFNFSLIFGLNLDCNNKLKSRFKPIFILNWHKVPLSIIIILFKVDIMITLLWWWIKICINWIMYKRFQLNIFVEIKSFRCEASLEFDAYLHYSIIPLFSQFVLDYFIQFSFF